jgi:hypothetical protein
VNPIKTGFQAQVGKRTKNKTGWQSTLAVVLPTTCSSLYFVILFHLQDYHDKMDLIKSL